MGPDDDGGDDRDDDVHVDSLDRERAHHLRIHQKLMSPKHCLPPCFRSRLDSRYLLKNEILRSFITKNTNDPSNLKGFTA